VLVYATSLLPGRSIERGDRCHRCRNEYRIVAARTAAGLRRYVHLSGPNGVILITGKVSNLHPPGCTIGCGPGGINFQQTMQNFVWATDSPSPTYLHSTLKVMDLDTGLTAAVLVTGTCANYPCSTHDSYPKFVPKGARRTDELCFNPDPKTPTSWRRTMTPSTISSPSGGGTILCWLGT
jgi:hypothetical protein